MTVLETLFTRPWKLFDITYIRMKSFSRLWTRNGTSKSHNSFSPKKIYLTTPLAAAMSAQMPPGLDELLATVSGTVLDIGSGTGDVLARFNPANITTMYGAEPAADMHAQLRANAEKYGFGNGKYVPMVCGAQPESLIPALAKVGVLSKGKSGHGVFDEICCVRVLCGVPRPKETIASLYSLLKPGGRLIVCEHVVNPWRTEGSYVGRFMQFAYTVLGWPFFMGGCELQRHTPEWVNEAAGPDGWEKVQVRYVEQKTVIPFWVGELRKRG